jgi:hypothetical protein
MKSSHAVVRDLTDATYLAIAPQLGVHQPCAFACQRTSSA